jgi:hypothetical protein
MGRRATKWRNRVEAHFLFVADYGFTTVDVDDSSFWSLYTQFRSSTAAIRVSRSIEFQRCEVELIRLDAGQVPSYPIWITEDRIDWALLDSVVEVRRPELMPEVKSHIGLRPAQIEAQLAFWAEVLRAVAGDFLAGDFAAIDEAAALSRRRVAEHPQEMTVWIPPDSPEGSELDQAVESRNSVPAEVNISVRRYRQGRAPDR